MSNIKTLLNFEHENMGIPKFFWKTCKTVIMSMRKRTVFRKKLRKIKSFLYIGRFTKSHELSDENKVNIKYIADAKGRVPLSKQLTGPGVNGLSRYNYCYTQDTLLQNIKGVQQASDESHVQL